MAIFKISVGIILFACSVAGQHREYDQEPHVNYVDSGQRPTGERKIVHSTFEPSIGQEIDPTLIAGQQQFEQNDSPQFVNNGEPYLPQNQIDLIDQLQMNSHGPLLDGSLRGQNLNHLQSVVGIPPDLTSLNPVFTNGLDSSVGSLPVDPISAVNPSLIGSFIANLRDRRDNTIQRRFLSPINRVLLALLGPRLMSFQADMMAQAFLGELIRKLVSPVISAVATRLTDTGLRSESSATIGNQQASNANQNSQMIQMTPLFSPGAAGQQQQPVVLKLAGSVATTGNGQQITLLMRPQDIGQQMAPQISQHIQQNMPAIQQQLKNQLQLQLQATLPPSLPAQVQQQVQAHVAAQLPELQQQLQTQLTQQLTNFLQQKIVASGAKITPPSVNTAAQQPMFIVPGGQKAIMTPSTPQQLIMTPQSHPHMLFSTPQMTMPTQPMQQIQLQVQSPPAAPSPPPMPSSTNQMMLVDGENQLTHGGGQISDYIQLVNEQESQGRPVMLINGATGGATVARMVVKGSGEQIFVMRDVPEADGDKETVMKAPIIPPQRPMVYLMNEEAKSETSDETTEPSRSPETDYLNSVNEIIEKNGHEMSPMSPQETTTTTASPEWIQRDAETTMAPAAVTKSGLNESDENERTQRWNSVLSNIGKYYERRESNDARDY